MKIKNKQQAQRRIELSGQLLVTFTVRVVRRAVK
jgi:hypothetical protein